jgi:transcriptional regulator with XRE-family HTH domain
MVNFGRVIKLYRAKQGLTQRVLARKANITVPYLSKLENDRKEPSLPLLKKLCRLLRLPEEVLFWEAVELSRTLSPKDRKVIEVAKHIVHRYAEA